MKVKRILFPTDFSVNAERAFQVACGIAKKAGAEFKVLHIGDIPTFFNSESYSSFSEMEEEKKSQLLQQIEFLITNNCSDSLNSPFIKKEVKLEASTFNGIMNTIREYKPDLVVMGMKGQSKLKELIMGSTTKKLIAHSPSPVLAVPEKAATVNFKNIVYASDFETGDISALQQLATWADLYDAEIAVLHIFPSEADMEKMNQFEEELVLNINYRKLNYATLVSDNIGEEILEYLKSSKGDLLVFYEKGTGNLLDKYFHEDLAKLFATHAEVPVLCYNKYCLAPVSTI